MKDALEPLRLILQLGALVIVASLAPFVVGIWFVRRFQTSPWVLCLFGMVSVGLTMAAVYRVTAPLYAQAERRRRARTQAKTQEEGPPSKARRESRPDEETGRELGG